MLQTAPVQLNQKHMSSIEDDRFIGSNPPKPPFRPSADPPCGLSGFPVWVTERRQTGLHPSRLTSILNATRRDRDGSGTVQIRFQPEFGRFLGRWGLDRPVPGNVFNGYRRRPPAVS
jgi:hypothetical protein